MKANEPEVQYSDSRKSRVTRIRGRKHDPDSISATRTAATLLLALLLLLRSCSPPPPLPAFTFTSAFLPFAHPVTNSLTHSLTPSLSLSRHSSPHPSVTTHCLTLRTTILSRLEKQIGFSFSFARTLVPGWLASQAHASQIDLGLLFSFFFEHPQHKTREIGPEAKHRLMSHCCCCKCCKCCKCCRWACRYDGGRTER